MLINLVYVNQVGLRTRQLGIVRITVLINIRHDTLKCSSSSLFPELCLTEWPTFTGFEIATVID